MTAYWAIRALGKIKSPAVFEEIERQMRYGRQMDYRLAAIYAAVEMGQEAGMKDQVL